MRLTQLLDAARRHHGERPAIIEGDKRLSYAALHDRAGRCAGLFRSLGVGEEDRVCILALNSPRNLEALFGAIWAGGLSEQRRVGTECVRTCSSRWWPEP